MLGSNHVLLITKDENLWCCGWNFYGQLCLNNTREQSKPKQTSYSNVIKISTGFHCQSLFQKANGELFSCGWNKLGTLGLGHCKSPQIKVCPILDQPPEIIHFCCGSSSNFFLDIEGNVFSVGGNDSGSLGLGPNRKILKW